ncbi:TetR/AcrR family transcriptional regulator [Burkholderiaceae bacterium DAT-1]|nr:TetR/AcrR family transcriptional regulator [Burkholderiaceae bacterium DAT-1]
MSHEDTPCPIGQAITRWTRRKEARPGEILDASLDLFAEKGFSATRMDDIAKRAGVTAGTLYRYFPNKEDIFKALVNDAFAPVLHKAIAEFSTFAGPAPETLRQILSRWWDAIGATRYSAIAKLLFSEGGNFPAVTELHRAAVIDPGEALIARALAYGIERGEFKPVDIPITVKVVIAPILMAMLWKHTPAACCNFEHISLDDYVHHAIDTLINGLLPRPEGDLQ